MSLIKRTGTNTATFKAKGNALSFEEMDANLEFLASNLTGSVVNITGSTSTNLRGGDVNFNVSNVTVLANSSFTYNGNPVATTDLLEDYVPQSIYTSFTSSYEFASASLSSSVTTNTDNIANLDNRFVIFSGSYKTMTGSLVASGSGGHRFTGVVQFDSPVIFNSSITGSTAHLTGALSGSSISASSAQINSLTAVTGSITRLIATNARILTSLTASDMLATFANLKSSTFGDNREVSINSTGIVVSGSLVASGSTHTLTGNVGVTGNVDVTGTSTVTGSLIASGSTHTMSGSVGINGGFAVGGLHIDNFIRLDGTTQVGMSFLQGGVENHKVFQDASGFTIYGDGKNKFRATTIDTILNGTNTYLQHNSTNRVTVNSVGVTLTGTNSSVGSMTVTGSLVASGSAHTITGTTTVTGNVNTVGTNTTTGSLVASGSTHTITGTTTVTGTTNIVGTTTVTGSLVASGSTHTITGTTNVNGTTTVTGSLVASGSANITGATTIVGTTTVSGSLLVQTSASVDGAIKAGINHVVSGAGGKMAVGARNTVSGQYAFSQGIDNTVSGQSSFASGENHEATNNQSFAVAV
jgi:hypothetical protein